MLQDNLPSVAPIVPKAYLNHLQIFADEQTYRDIEQSTFLRHEFAWFEQRMTVADSNQSAWTGVYLYGENTYFEFMDPLKTSWQRIDGIAFGVDEPGACRVIQERLQSQLPMNVTHRLRTRKHHDDAVPWFYQTRFDRGETAHLQTWVMEYHSDFLRRWYPGLTPQTGGITRNYLLERYRAKVARESPAGDRDFEDIVEVTLALPAEDVRRFAQEVSVYGYAVSNDGLNTICEGPEIRFVVVPGTPPNTGITSFKMALCRNRIGQQVYHFGPKSVLAFHEDETAVWTFH